MRYTQSMSAPAHNGRGGDPDLVVRIATLGCKVNQADSEALAAQLLRRGYRIAAADEPAAVCIVNTCTVTHVADAKARKLIRRLARSNPQAALVVAGCGAERGAPDLAALPGVTRVVPNRQRDELPRIIECMVGAPDAAPAIAPLAEPRPARRGSVRAFVKVQDGCDHGCAYCIVPQVRGPVRSRPLAQVLAEMRELARAGAREIVLCGIRLGTYGGESGGRGLAQLLRAAAQLPVARLRLSSIEPWDIGEELMREIAANPLLCPHLHLPLQSGDDQVLRAMGRPYSYGDYRALARRLREVVPDLAITTDLMVGFPGESDLAFANTCRAVQEVGFARAHIFRYSPRSGTRAAAMTNQVPEAVKTQRAAALARVARESAQAFARRFVGRVVPVLFEECAQGMCRGLTNTYLAARAPGDPSLVGQVAGVKVRAIEEMFVTGEVVSLAAA